MKWHKVGDENPKKGQFCLCRESRLDNNGSYCLYCVCEYLGDEYTCCWSCWENDDAYERNSYDEWVGIDEIEALIE